MILWYSFMIKWGEGRPSPGTNQEYRLADKEFGYWSPAGTCDAQKELHGWWWMPSLLLPTHNFSICISCGSETEELCLSASIIHLLPPTLMQCRNCSRIPIQQHSFINIAFLTKLPAMQKHIQHVHAEAWTWSSIAPCLAVSGGIWAALFTQFSEQSYYSIRI